MAVDTCAELLKFKNLENTPVAPRGREEILNGGERYGSKLKKLITLLNQN